MTPTLILIASPSLPPKLLRNPFRGQASALQAAIGQEMGPEVLPVVEALTQPAMIKVRFHPMQGSLVLDIATLTSLAQASVIAAPPTRIGAIRLMASHVILTV